MKKVALAATVVIAFIGYLLINHNSSNSTSSSPSIPLLASPTTTQVQANGYKDGTYTGTVADAFYGSLQVQTTISGGKITDVQFLQYPNDRDTSREINGRAMPILRSEAIAAQSAQVAIVSGATQTSGAFLQTMQSTLDQAK